MNENGFEIVNNVLVKYKGQEENAIIPDGVTSIGEHAFSWCSNLTSITIPNSVTRIGNYAFFYCSNLTDVIIPNSVTTIGERVFDGCDDLDTIVVPDSVVNIAKHAFDTFDRDKFAEEQTSICEFYEDWNPDECQKKLDAMSEEDYTYCDIIIRANPDSYIVQYAKENRIEYTVDGSFIMKGSTLVRYVGTKGDVVVPDGVTCISEYVFSFDSDITSITIPGSVMKIGTCAFNPCSSLTSVTIGNGVTSIGYKAFCGCSNLTVITIPNSVTSIGDDAFRGCKNLTIQACRNSYAAQYAKENNIKLEII
jgi:hypothetical protein